MSALFCQDKVFMKKKLEAEKIDLEHCCAFQTEIQNFEGIVCSS